MTLEEYNQLNLTVSKPNEIHSAELFNKADRTLIWGYDLARNSFHLYLKNHFFYLAVYDFNERLLKSSFTGTSIVIHSCIPSKRAYPEACDYEFCSLIHKYGEHIPFTVFDPRRIDRQFHGEIFPESAFNDII